LSSEFEELTYVVEDVDSGLRSDKFLSDRCAELSRSRLQGLISDGHVTANGVVLTTPSTKTVEGDSYVVRVPPPVDSVPKAEDIPIDVVYEDADVLVINKAVGMVVHPGAGNWDGTLVNALLHHCGDTLSGIGGVIRPGIVHRLDKDTSGLMLVAKNDHAHQHLSAQLADRSLSRVYHALVMGVPVPIKGSIDRPIGRHRHNRLKMSVMSNAPRDARTHYKVIENYRDAFALVECKLESGRTHQIRVHMEALGHPLIGDKMYGPQLTGLLSKLKYGSYATDFVDVLRGFPRQMLHAQTIEFIHPVTEKVMSFSCNAPEDIQDVLGKIK